MKKIILKTTVKNYSAYNIDTVWENAQDLEHVKRLHPNTNHKFSLLHTYRSPNSKYQYDVLIFNAVRKEKFITLSSHGFRQIISDYNLYQVEYLPFLGMRTALNSLLYRNKDPKYPTLMVDEVVMEVPFFFAPFKNHIIRSMHEHARIQCAEDEPFRARRTLLAEREINRPLRIFSRSEFQDLTDRFTLAPDNAPA